MVRDPWRRMTLVRVHGLVLMVGGKPDEKTGRMRSTGGFMNGLWNIEGTVRHRAPVVGPHGPRFNHSADP